MKLNQIVCSVLAVGVVSLFAGCSTEKGEEHHGKESQAQLMSEATVSKAEAERIALARVPNGTIKEAELEREKGRLIWSFDMNSSDIAEVNVDAKTGEVVAVEKASSSSEAKENSKKEKDDDDKN